MQYFFGNSIFSHSLYMSKPIPFPPILCTCPNQFHFLPFSVHVQTNSISSHFLYMSKPIPFPPILCTCPNQCKPFKLIVSVTVGFLTIAYNLVLIPCIARLRIK